MRNVRRIYILLSVQAVQEIRRFRKLMRVNQAAMIPSETTVVHTAPRVLQHRVPMLQKDLYGYPEEREPWRPRLDLHGVGQECARGCRV
jgi:hypothetical protein